MSDRLVTDRLSYPQWEPDEIAMTIKPQVCRNLPPGTVFQRSSPNPTYIMHVLIGTLIDLSGDLTAADAMLIARAAVAERLLYYESIDGPAGPGIELIIGELVRTINLRLAPANQHLGPWDDGSGLQHLAVFSGPVPSDLTKL